MGKTVRAAAVSRNKFRLRPRSTIFPRSFYSRFRKVDANPILACVKLNEDYESLSKDLRSLTDKSFNFLLSRNDS